MATILCSISDDCGDQEITDIYLAKGSAGKFKLNFDIDDSECNGVEVVLTPSECAKLIVLLQTVVSDEESKTVIETKVRR